MLRVIQKLFALLTRQERVHLLLLFVALILMAFIEMVGIASIMPFMAVVANAEVIHTNRWLKLLHDAGGFATERDFLMALGMVVLGLLILSNFLKALNAWLTLKYDNRLNYMLGQRLLGRYLARPYLFFLNRNTSELARNVLLEIRNVIIGILSPGMQALSGIFVSFFILALLVVVDPLIAVTIAAVLGGTYTAIYLLSRHRLIAIGKEQLRASTMKFQVANESLNAIKDLKILGRENVFLERFTSEARAHARSNIAAGTIAQLPRYVLEVLAFGGILLIVLYSLHEGQGSERMVPLMALYAFAGYRLLPALQQVFAGAASVRCSLAGLDLLYRDFMEGEPFVDTRVPSGRPADLDPLPFTRALELKNVRFAYPGTRDGVLNGINLSIRPNSIVGIVGATGSGKTTTADLILGLFQPSSGTVVVDGVEIREPVVQRWQRSLGYVPQSIFLCDDTVARNIAVGVPDEEIDMEAVVRAARTANLATFIEEELPEGYHTLIGERGVRLSGGQRQRIGIARALYRDPAVLIMDEATSALDGVTEDAVLDAIRNLSRKNTVIIIAHRLTTVRECDVIYLLDHGRIVAQGDFAFLQRSSQWFRTVARTGT